MASIFGDTYAVPTAHKDHALHDTATMPSTTIAIGLTVTTAGVVPLQMWNSPAATDVPFAIGQHYLPGNWKLAKSTGTTAVLTGTKVTAYYANVAGLSH